MKPEFMRLRRALAGALAALLMAVGIVVLSPALSASAHTPSVTASCTSGLNVNLKSYPSGTHVLVDVNGARVTETSFGGGWNNSYPWDRKVDNSFKVVVMSPDDPSGDRGWSFTKKETVKGCPPADTPQISITASTCSPASASNGTISFSLSGATRTYTVTLLSGSTVKATTTSTGGTGTFSGVGPGTYTVKAVQGSVSTTSGSMQVPTCAPLIPEIDVVAQPCVAGGTLGAITANLSNLAVGTQYEVTLMDGSGVALETLPLSATAATHTMSFPGQGPGQYSVAIYDASGGLLAVSADATILECSAEFTLTVELEPCVTLQSGAAREINVTVDGLDASTVYTVRLMNTASPAVEIDSTTTPGDDATTFTHTFSGVPSPGQYKVEVVGGSGTLVSETISAANCGLDTLAPPSIDLLIEQCDGVDSMTGALTARMIDLDATKTYYVRLVDGSGTTVIGGEDQTVTGATTATVQFPGVTAPGTYTAQLLIDPGKQLAATSPSSADLEACLPTLAMTGPGALVPLGSVAALLLTLGGAVVMGRLRRRMAL